MKRFAAIAALLGQLVAFIPSAQAAYPTQDPPALNTNFRVPKNKRVIVIRPSRWEAFATTLIEQTCIINGVYQAIDMLRAQGCHVDVVNSRMFESYAGGSRLWRTLGDTYQLAIVLNPPVPAGSGNQRYWNGDSTNVQLLVVGGVRTNALQWNPDSSGGVWQTRGMFDYSPGSCASVVIGQSRFAGAAAYDPSSPTGLSADTIWSYRLPTGRSWTDSAGTILRGANSGGSILGVYRVLHPLNPGDSPAAWAGGTAGQSCVDTASTSLPSTVDSLVRGAEWMSPIWKVKYAPSAVNTDTSEVWFLKLIGGTASSVMSQTTPTLLWACIARFVDVPPIKYAFDFDDVTDINDSNNFPRWTNSQAESLLAGLRGFGITIGSNGINPRAAPGYVRGHTPETETQPYAAGTDSVPWIAGQPGHSYIKGLIWTHHSHDSTNGSITSNLVGGYGGYQPSNGAYTAGNFQTGRRYASRWNPGANEAGFMGAGGNFGIVQRLEYSDSVRRALGVRGDRPPYLTFPANQMLPINWRERRGNVDLPTQSGLTAAQSDSLFKSVAGYLCPIDSVLWAYDYFLNGRQTSGRGDVWLRSGLISRMRQEALWADRDSFVAAMLGSFPRDRWSMRVSGRMIQANVVNSFTQGGSTRAQYIENAAIRAAGLLGLANRVNKSERHAAFFGETYNSDAGAIMNQGTGTVDFPARQSTRVMYLHPSGSPFGPNVSPNYYSRYGDYTTECVLLGLHSNIRAMDAIAGRQVTKCVPAWHVYTE